MKILQFSILSTISALAACSKQPDRHVDAVVESIVGPASPKWNAKLVLVTARSADGAAGSKSVLDSRLTCRLGDTIQATEMGIALELDSKACER
jgi:hypothetical protein